MEKNLLTLAVNYQKERNWNKAIECFDQYIQENKSACADTVYTSYARSLRIVGKTALAKEMLAEGKKRHPKSERLLLEFHNLYDFLGEWESAKNVAENLIKMNPEKADYHLRLGRTYSFQSNHKKAKKAYQTALEYKHRLPFEELTARIQQGFAETPANVSSKYVFIDGKNNFGALIHQIGDKKLFTKISNHANKNSGASREENFYKDLCTAFPQLKNLVPKYVDSQMIDKVSYLTIEMIDSAPLVSDHAKKVIEVSRQISTVSYGKLADFMSTPDYVFQFRKGRAISVIHFFTHIHEEKINKKMFEALRLIMKQHHYPKAVLQLIGRLETAIMDNHLYAFIKPEEHYSLLHGDFAFQNLLIRKEDETPCVIDWTTYTIGPHFMDLARYFTSLLLPYSEIKRLYLETDQNSKKLSPIEHIFFLYALIVFYFQKLGRKGIETELSAFILPALEDLEVLVMKFKLSIEGDQLTEEMAEKELKIKQMEQKISVLEDERKHLHQRLQDTLNSKSWKMTAPLRLFTERKKLKE